MRQCTSCGRWFKNIKALNAHKRHCLGDSNNKPVYIKEAEESGEGR